MNKIIYIIGAGRSGTTLLDIILGNADDIFSAGELNRFTKRDGIPHDARNFAVENFWSNVKQQLFQKGFGTPETYYKTFSKFEYHSSVFNTVFPYNQKAFEEYALYQQTLFQLITNNAIKAYKKSIVVDSSKYPMRAFFLSKIFKEEISFIYIKRNAQSVIESFQKKEVEQPSKSRFKANLYLLFVNGISNQLIKSLKKNHNVSTVIYENLLASPVSTISKIEEDLKIDLQTPKEKIKSNEALKVGLLFDGNRLRLSEEIHFKAGTKINKPKFFIDKFFAPFHKII